MRTRWSTATGPSHCLGPREDGPRPVRAQAWECASAFACSPRITDTCGHPATSLADISFDFKLWLSFFAGTLFGFMLLWVYVSEASSQNDRLLVLCGPCWPMLFGFAVCLL